MMKTEKSNDLISRADAVEAVKQAIYNHDSAIMRIASLPSASVEVGEWIPVSERLPEVHPFDDGEGMTWDESDDVLICMNYGNMHVAIYEVDSEARRYWVGMDGYEFNGVTAWMPLPEPYREDGE